MLLTTLKAMADDGRLRLLAILARGEFTVQELTEILAMGQSRISRHLKILTEAGLLTVTRQGTWAYYRMNHGNPLLDGIWPVLQQEIAANATCRQDQTALGAIFEKRRSRSRDFFDRHAQSWDQLAQQILPTPPYLAQLLGLIPPCQRLLEVGVGTGRLLARLKEHSENVVGVDHSPAMLDEARKRLEQEGVQGVELRLGEMSHLPLADGECDAALLNMVLHHAADPPLVLSELARILAPGGGLLLADLVRHGAEWVREEIADQWLGFEQDELHRWLEQSGFTLNEYRVVPGIKNEHTVFMLRAHRRVGPVNLKERS